MSNNPIKKYNFSDIGSVSVLKWKGQKKPIQLGLSPMVCILIWSIRIEKTFSWWNIRGTRIDLFKWQNFLLLMWKFRVIISKIYGYSRSIVLELHNAKATFYSVTVAQWEFLRETQSLTTSIYITVETGTLIYTMLYCRNPPLLNAVLLFSLEHLMTEMWRSFPLPLALLQLFEEMVDSAGCTTIHVFIGSFPPLSRKE